MEKIAFPGKCCIQRELNRSIFSIPQLLKEKKNLPKKMTESNEKCEDADKEKNCHNCSTNRIRLREKNFYTVSESLLYPNGSNNFFLIANQFQPKVFASFLRQSPYSSICIRVSYSIPLWHSNTHWIG